MFVMYSCFEREYARQRFSIIHENKTRSIIRMKKKRFKQNYDVINERENLHIVILMESRCVFWRYNFLNGTYINNNVFKQNY